MVKFLYNFKPGDWRDMTGPSNKTKTSKAAIFSMTFALMGMVALIAGTLAAVFAFTQRENPDFDKILAPLIIVCGFWSILSGLIGILVADRSQKKPWTKNLSIAAIVLGFLLLLIPPQVLRFSARANQAEARQNLQAIYAAYQSYHNQYQTYPASPSILVDGKSYNCLGIAGWKNHGRMRSTFECAGSPVYWPGRDQGEKATPCNPPLATQATKDSFTIGACGNIDSDPTIDEWTIDDSGYLRNVVDDVWK